MPWRTRDRALRRAAFERVLALQRAYANAIPWQALSAGFVLDGERHFLTSKAEGIYKPKGHPAVLSVKTTVPRGGRRNPYSDQLMEDGGLLRYAYRARGGPDCAANQSIRVALEHRLPILYFAGLGPGVYSAVVPMFVVDDLRRTREFALAPGAGLAVAEMPDHAHLALNAPVDRRYAAQVVLKRLHQRGFRHQVLDAYSHRCAMCSIRFDEFLDAAHILPDRHHLGVPDVRNGLALCGLHHRAFDRFLVDVDDDYRIRLSPELRRRRDGPLFKGAFLDRDAQPIALPRSPRLWPGLEFLQERRTQRPPEFWSG